jgi:ferritin-like metal-binding protein YciE
VDSFNPLSGSANLQAQHPQDIHIEPKTITTVSELNSLKDLLVEEIKDLYSAENQLLKALPKMAEAATNPDLKAGFTEHLQQTRGHVGRLEKAGELLGESPKGKTCKAMEGLVEEGAEAIETDAPDAIRDANLIGAAQRVEHYEIAAYGTANAFAEKLGLDDVAQLLQATLDEETATDEKLTALSDTVNDEAVSASDDEDGEA